MIPTPNVYCPFCGVILLPEPYWDDVASLQSRIRPWYREVRGLYSTNATAGCIATTGLGIVRGKNRLFAPLDSDKSYVDVGVEELEEWRLFGSSTSRWCFGFHNSCWKLLLLRLGRGLDDASQSEAIISESVFYQLYCTPCILGSIFQFGHDYEGAMQTHKSFGRPKPVDPNYFYADPCKIPSIEGLQTTASKFLKMHDSLLWKEQGTRPTAIAARSGCHSEEAAASGPFEPNGNCPSVPPDVMTEQMHEKLDGTKHSLFDGLSPELVFDIFSYLSFDELLNMRLVCRDLAQLAIVDMLPQSYWRSRFLLSQEADFLFLNVKDMQDWYLLFFGTRAALMAGNRSLINRKRIRQLIEPIATLVGLEPILRNGPYGSAVHPVQSQGGYYNYESAENTSGLIEVASFFSGYLTSVSADSPLDGPLGEACRVIYYRTQSFVPPLPQYRRRIGISTIQFGARRFISGINLFPSGECSVVNHQVGYHNPASETWIEIPDNFHVKALGVAFCSQGLTGIKFIYTGSNSSRWVGNSNGPGIAHGTLSIPEKSNRHCLLVGLDKYKIVSLGLGKAINDLEIPQSPSEHVVD
ncbi:uncharacterized protein PGRI_012650 [Penicillium griseofulvum]|uniref:F-box domain-containing protein n=1 Tax=Penicillium patulum TaxID=5078 RepID=A0A135LEK8_PENPA|nr:uncharacterized protein PGRI_012650 [Penicillium griseofulvum]KXG47395.1 hypothetical protein PGRI_012650 [Penicillium griseofulvum]